MRDKLDYTEYFGSVHLATIYKKIVTLLSERSKLKIDKEVAQLKLESAKMFVDDDSFRVIAECDNAISKYEYLDLKTTHILAEMAILAKINKGELIDGRYEKMDYKQLNDRLYEISCLIVDNWLKEYIEHLRNYLKIRSIEPENNREKKELFNFMDAELKKINLVERVYTKHFDIFALVDDKLFFDKIMEELKVIPFDVLIASRFLDMIEQHNMLIAISDDFVNSNEDFSLDSTLEQAELIKEKLLKFNEKYSKILRVTNLFQLPQTKELIKFRKLKIDRTILKPNPISNPKATNDDKNKENKR